MNLWLLYDEADYAVNRAYVQLMQQRGAERDLKIEPILTNELSFGMYADGTPFCLRNGEVATPKAVLSRQRNWRISLQFEQMGVPVFNNARVCALCNDKRSTYQFLRGLPMPQTLFLKPDQFTPPKGTSYPVIIKPACSHGGDRVTLVTNEAEWCDAAARILPQPALQQAVVSDAGCDLRVYVLHGQILAGVMRTARTGVVSNFKQGGHVALHKLTEAERQLAQAVIDRFADANAPLYMAGVDLLYHKGQPVIGEIEDVVGSRMLYQTSHIDIVKEYLKGLPIKNPQ